MDTTLKWTVHKLAPREHACLRWAARGKTYADIVLIEELSHASVKTYLDTARYKLNAVNLTQAVGIAVALGILTMDDLTG